MKRFACPAAALLLILCTLGACGPKSEASLPARLQRAFTAFWETPNRGESQEDSQDEEGLSSERAAGPAAGGSAVDGGADTADQSADPSTDQGAEPPDPAVPASPTNPSSIPPTPANRPSETLPPGYVTKEYKRVTVSYPESWESEVRDQNLLIGNGYASFALGKSSGPITAAAYMRPANLWETRDACQAVAGANSILLGQGKVAISGYPGYFYTFVMDHDGEKHLAKFVHVLPGRSLYTLLLLASMSDEYGIAELESIVATIDIPADIEGQTSGGNGTASGAGQDVPDATDDRFAPNRLRAEYGRLAPKNDAPPIAAGDPAIVDGRYVYALAYAQAPVGTLALAGNRLVITLDGDGPDDAPVFEGVCITAIQALGGYTRAEALEILAHDVGLYRRDGLSFIHLTAKGKRILSIYAQ